MTSVMGSPNASHIHLNNVDVMRRSYTTSKNNTNNILKENKEKLRMIIEHTSKESIKIV